tara:strand:+ start:177 stop:503 length:327 start_codon:yes stop_codon:yes gene_type:complete
MSFDPSDLTVKKVIEKMHGLSDEELDALYDDELEGKGRTSLLDAITSARDDIREEDAEEEEAPAPAPAPKPEPAKAVEEIGSDTFMRLSQYDRKNWKCVAPDRFVKVG